MKKNTCTSQNTVSAAESMQVSRDKAGKEISTMKKISAILKWLFTPVPETYDYRFFGCYPMV